MTSISPVTSTDVPAYSCSLSAVLLARVQRVAGHIGVRQVLDRAGSPRSLEYLQDISNWVSFDEAIALWDAGEAITHDSHFARHVGEDTSKMLAATSTATLIRALGSTEENLRHLNVSSQRWSTAARVETIEVRPGYCEFRAEAAPGFIRHRHHCECAIGLASQAPVLFGLEPAFVNHTECQVLGAPHCRYEVTWNPAASGANDDGQIAVLRGQLQGLSARLDGVFAAAADLISSGDLRETLMRIGERAAEQVRAPAYLLAVRLDDDADIVCHQRGLDEETAQQVADGVLGTDDHPSHWCVAHVRSHRRDYGRLVAMYPEGSGFLAQERDLLDLYARYAATALDSAAALVEARNGRDQARRRDREARTLLKLARVLASAGTTEQVAQRLADAAPGVIDCDRVSVWLWDEERGELTRSAVNSTGRNDEDLGRQTARPEDIPQLAAWLEHPDPEPYFTDMQKSPIVKSLKAVDAVASVAVPIATAERLLGTVQVSVRERPERLAPSPELSERLSGLAAHAVIALENGRLVDHITHQAHHDQLTGLRNRLALRERVAAASRDRRGKPGTLALFFVDLDWFKPVNDEFGHEVGDALLRAVAERLVSDVRPEDVVARIGGDEFAVLVENADPERTRDVITDRIRRALDAPFIVADHRFTISASIGYATCAAEVADLDRLLRDADAVMYEAKRSRYERE
jgi:diguanylate cyclase (GGDEF)-like protein